MDKFTKLIEENIHKKYKSIRAFSKAVGLPQTTISSALKVGFGNTNFYTVMKICSFLDIPINDIPVDTFNEDFTDILNMYSSLDKTGTDKLNALIDKIKP